MGSREYKSGSFSETSKCVKPKVEEVKTTCNEFKGMKVRGETKISGSDQGNYEVLPGGELKISGALAGNILINGGHVKISGAFNGKVIMESGSMKISGMATGIMEYKDGDIKCSGINNLRMM